MKKTVLLVAICLGMLSFALSSYAATPAAKGVYLGINVGYGRLMEINLGVSNCEFSSISGAIDLGYKFTPYFALETGVSLFNRETIDTGVTADNNYILHLAGKLIIPLRNSGVSLFVKGGGAIMHTRINNSGSLSIENTGNRTQPTLYGGIGGNYFFTPNLALTVQSTGTLKNKTVPYTYMITGGVTYIIPANFMG